MSNCSATPDDLNILRYPIGCFSSAPEITQDIIDGLIILIEISPFALKKAVEGLSEGEINTEYRPGGWNIRQVVHHLADPS